MQLAEQYARGGRPERALAYYHRAADVAAGRFAYTEEIRLHEQALSVIAAMPAGRDRDSRELGVLEAMAAPLNARHGYASPQVQHALERSVTLAESLGRADSRLAALASLGGALFVQGRSADSYRTASQALELAASESKLAGQAHLIAGFSAFSLGMPAEALTHLELAAHLAAGAVWLSFGTRPRRARERPSPRTPCGCSAARTRRWPSAVRPSRWPRAIDHPYSLVLALSYACVTHQMRRDLPELRNAVEELRRLCDQYGFAYYQEWALIADGCSRADESGLGLVRHGVGNLRAQGAFARMPYWLTLLADLYSRAGRPRDARATLDAALATGHAHRDVWWLPEVMRMRAAYDDEQAAISRLRLAAQLAADSGSVALLRRCERDLSARGGQCAGRQPGRWRRSPGRLAPGPRSERCANARVRTFGLQPTRAPHPRGPHDHTEHYHRTVRRTGRRSARRPDPARRPRLRRGPRRLQRHDRQAPGRHPPAAGTPPTSSPACGSPARTAAKLRSAGAATMRPGSGCGTAPWSSDLSAMRGVNVNPQDRTVRVDAGATWGDVDHATGAFGMATPSGFIASTGVAG